MASKALWLLDVFYHNFIKYKIKIIYKWKIIMITYSSSKNIPISETNNTQIKRTKYLIFYLRYNIG